MVAWCPYFDSVDKLQMCSLNECPYRVCIEEGLWCWGRSAHRQYAFHISYWTKCKWLLFMWCDAKGCIGTTTQGIPLQKPSNIICHQVWDLLLEECCTTLSWTVQRWKQGDTCNPCLCCNSSKSMFQVPFGFVTEIAVGMCGIGRVVNGWKKACRFYGRLVYRCIQGTHGLP